MSASLMGRQVAVSGRATAAAIPTVEEALFQKSATSTRSAARRARPRSPTVLGYKIDVSVPTVLKFTATGTCTSASQYVEQTISGDHLRARCERGRQTQARRLTSARRRRSSCRS